MFAQKVKYYTNIIWVALENLSITRIILILFIVYGIATIGHLARYEFNPSSLIRIGHYYARQNPVDTPEGAVILTGNQVNGGNGYDGQIFYYYAQTLLKPGVWPDGFSKSYRAPRVGYPLLVSPFSLLGPWSTVFGMVFVQLLLITGGTIALYDILKESGQKKYTLIHVLSPFLLQSYMVLVSDAVMVSLVLMGYWCYRKIQNDKGGRISIPHLAGAFLFFSLSITAKESALFFLFPLGLDALRRISITKIGLMISILIPAVIWQLYLKEVHGILPAGKLSVFLSPFDGLIGLAKESGVTLAGAAHSPIASLKVISKLSARWVLALLIVFAIGAVFTGDKKRILNKLLPGGLGVLLVLFSVIMADHFYFWGIYENISRMFTLMVPAAIIMKGEDSDSRTGGLFALILLLFIMVLLRVIFVTPVFPHTEFHHYTGPDYSNHAPLPGGVVR